MSAFDFDRRTTFVVGAAESGQSIARDLLREGDQVLLSDLDATRALEPATRSVCDSAPGLLRYSAGRHDPLFAASADRVVLSPGVPFDAEIVGVARHHDVPVYSAVEFVAGRLDVPLVLVTGTSGKTTLVDVLRRLISDRRDCEGLFLTDRAAGVTLAQALDAHGTRAVVAEASVRELDGVQRLEPALLVVTNLAETNNHAEFDGFDAYFQAKLGWLTSLEGPLRVVASESDRRRIETQLERLGRTGAALHFEPVDPGAGPTGGLVERLRHVLKTLRIEIPDAEQRIRVAIRETLLARCETIEGFALPILNIGECKNADALFWTASALCASPRVITAAPLDGMPASAWASRDVIDLSSQPVALEEAIERWRHAEPGAPTPTIVIDEAVRRRLWLR